MIYLEAPVEEIAEKYGLPLGPKPCPWCAGIIQKPKGVRTKDSIGFEWRCECGGWSFEGTPVTEEAKNFWNLVMGIE